MSHQCWDRCNERPRSQGQGKECSLRSQKTGKTPGISPSAQGITFRHLRVLDFNFLYLYCGFQLKISSLPYWDCVWIIFFCTTHEHVIFYITYDYMWHTYDYVFYLWFHKQLSLTLNPLSINSDYIMAYQMSSVHVSFLNNCTLF